MTSILLNAVMAILFFACIRSAKGAPAIFQNDLSIQNLFISNPYQADVTSSYNGTLNGKSRYDTMTSSTHTNIVVVRDGDYPNSKPVHCQIAWKAGVGPPDTTQHQCENVTTRIWFPEYTFEGVKDFQLQIARTVIDTRFVVYRSCWSTC